MGGKSAVQVRGNGGVIDGFLAAKRNIDRTQNNRLEMGRNAYQKPTPKQDKGGGIIPTAEGARIVLTSSKQRGGILPPRCLLLRPLLALNTRETRVWERKPKRGMGRKLAPYESAKHMSL